MPKVLRIINRLNLGGPTFNAAYLTHYLAPEFETKLVAGMKDESEASSQFILDNLGITAERVPEMHREVDIRNDLKAYRKIRSIIRTFKPDIVHTHAAKAGAVGRLAAISGKVPVILHTFHGHVFHSYFSPVKTRLFLAIERYLARKSSGIIAISQKQKEELGQQFRICPPEKIHLVPLGFDLAKFTQQTELKRKSFRERYQMAEDTVAIGIIGRLVPIKNHRMFLNVLKNLIGHTNSNIKAFIVGDGEDNLSVKAYARTLGIRYSTPEDPDHNAHLVFTSWITEIDEVNAGMDIIVLTSLNEGTPVSLIEAQAAGKPIVSTDVGGVRDVVQHGDSAFLTESKDEKAMTKYLETLIRDEKLRQKMGSKGRELVLEKYHYQRLVSDMRSLYKHLLEN